MGGLLLRGGCVLSLDKRVGNLDDADVLIEDDVIAEVGRDLRARDAEVVDATDTIVMPGFVDAHRHAWKTLLRGLGTGAGDDASADDHAHHFLPDDVYAATLLGLLSAAEAGVTTIVDWADIHLGDAYAEATFQAHADAGLRAVIVPVVPTWARSQVDADAALRHALALGEAAAPRVTVSYGHPDPNLSDLEDTAGRWRLARERGLRIHAHAGSSDRDHLAEVARLGLLDDDVTLVHCSGLSDGDLDAIASSGAAVALTPASEMARGLGVPPMQALIDREIRPGLGVDDELLTPGGLFAQMRSAQSLQHATVFDLKLAGKAGIPHLLGTREVIRYATVDGARVAGLGEVTGSLAPGKQADVVVLRTDRPNIAPVNDPIGAVVWGMDPSNVDWVIVGGRPLVRAGVLDADVGRARDLAVAARERLFGAGQSAQSAGGGSV